MADESPRPRADVPLGIEVLHDPRFNKSTAFTEAEREALHIRGLLPPRQFSQAAQLERVLGNLRRKSTDLERYIFSIGLQDRNETLFYRLVVDHIEEMMPIIYTPTVGEGCKQFAHIFRRPRGLYITANDRGRVGSVLQNWPEFSGCLASDPRSSRTLSTACPAITPNRAPSGPPMAKPAVPPMIFPRTLIVFS